MDLKGISWVGNIYEKFEAMCLEVEEVIYQDTVKYVENQVQTVGSSVKRFYSDVMQDLLPPNSPDSAKGDEINSPLDFHGDVGIYSKPKIETEEKHTKSNNMKKVKTGDRVKTANHNSEYAPTQKLSHVDNSCLDEDIKRISSSQKPPDEYRLPSRQKSNEESRISAGFLEESRNETEIAEIPADKHGIESSSGWKTEVNEVEICFASEMEVIEQADDENTKLEESCIFVNRDDFRFVHSCHGGKSKFYQKKICGVFSPRKSSRRKHEYEQLATWPTIPSLALKGADEAEWELL